MKIPCHGRLWNTYDAVDVICHNILSKISNDFSGQAVSRDFSKLGASRACQKYLYHGHFQQELSRGGHDSGYVAHDVNKQSSMIFFYL